MIVNKYEMMKEQKRKQILQNVSKIKKKQNNQNKGMWDLLVSGIVRPPRNQYELTNLGDKAFVVDGKIFHRKDYEVFHQGKKLDLNLFFSDRSSRYVCLYLHGNMSNRLQSIHLLQFLPSKVALGCFDFMGCGINQEIDTISLGVRQSEQTATVCDFLRNQGFQIIIWGRSMGAATALLYGKAKIIVADSAFRNFRTLCLQIAKKYSPKYFPNCLIECFFVCVYEKLRRDVKKRAQYNLQMLNIKKAIQRIDKNTLLILLSGDKDELIEHKNSQKLFNLFEGKNKHLILFDGDHNSRRPDEIFEKVKNLMSQHLQLKLPSFKSILQQSIKVKAGDSGIEMMREQLMQEVQNKKQLN